MRCENDYTVLDWGGSTVTSGILGSIQRRIYLYSADHPKRFTPINPDSSLRDLLRGTVGSTGPSARSADSGFADTDPDLMSFAISATGYCRTEIKARPRRGKVSNARRGDETEEEEKEGNMREIIFK
ncbi:PREDICTED: uncharacterized protein LOC105150502 [Acromyrmex echinatior]|uniref:uncharacterized protein LOC105150502 n=1 Tax=Acromyrmex echinatior TaxID=103372 RepID=UPI000580BDC3|nr:PREDICTED: uncharacterized protein LOC105150502 [Acromyrmex echinatior]